MIAGGAAAAMGAHHVGHHGGHFAHHGKFKHHGGKFKHGKFKHGKFKHGKHGRHGLFGGKFKKWK